MNPNQTQGVSAVIPAAGLSSRMHEYKPLLDLGGLPMVEQVIRLFQGAGIRDIVVVTGHNREQLEPVIRKSGARPVYNKGFTTGMLGSVKTGIRALPDKTCGFFLLPVDIPAIRPATIRELINAFVKTPDTIIFPSFLEQTGHPPLIPGPLIPDILSIPPRSNLGEFLSSPGLQKRAVYVHDRGIHMDADTPEAYSRLAKRFSRLDIPDREECLSLIRTELENDTALQDHMVLAGRVAKKLARAVAQAMDEQSPNPPCPGLRLNHDLIQAGAMLHDIKKRETDHAQAGKAFLESMGYRGTAAIVGKHMDLGAFLPKSLTEDQIVYFADKVCPPWGLDLDFDTRFKKKMGQFPHAKDNILRRHEHTRHIQARIETICQRSVRSILGQD